MRVGEAKTTDLNSESNAADYVFLHTDFIPLFHPLLIRFQPENTVFDVSKLTVFEVCVLENKNFNQKTTQKTTQKINDSQIAIINYLKINPKAGRKEIALNVSGITENGVKYNLRRLKELGLIKHI